MIDLSGKLDYESQEKIANTLVEALSVKPEVIDEDIEVTRTEEKKINVKTASNENITSNTTEEAETTAKVLVAE